MTVQIAAFQLYPNPKAEDCAMVIIDPQNDFMHDEGQYYKSGVDISHMQRILKPTKKMIDFCREMGIPIIVSQHNFRDAQIDCGIVCKVRPLLAKAGLRTGTWGADFAEELEIDPTREWVVPKYRLSCFYETKMESLMRCLGKTTLIVTGVVTNQCVESTIRDAQFRDMVVLELEDCVGAVGGVMMHPITKEEVIVKPEDMHVASLRAVKFGLGDVVQSDELIEELTKGK